MNCTHGATAHKKPGDKCAYCGSILTAAELSKFDGQNLDSPPAYPSLPLIVAARSSGQATSGEVGGDARHATEPAPRTIAVSAPTPATSPQPSLPGRGTPCAEQRHGADTALSSARTADPDTAHGAALAAANTDHRAVYAAILAVVHEHGPLTDYHLSLHVARRTGTPILRTSVGKRRGELRDMGLMCNSGHRAKTDTNTTAIRWALTPAGEQARSNAA